MKQSVSLIRLNDAPVCTLSSTTPDVPAWVDGRAREIWREEVQRRGANLFDGEIVSVVSINDSSIVGRRSDYRWLLAQSRDASIFKWSQIRPLAVTGLLLCRDGIVIGHRSKTVYQFPGMGELAPSGSVDMTTLDSDSRINLQQQLMLELREEIGITADEVIDVRPLAVVSDTDSQVFDVCFTVRTSKDWAEITQIFEKNGSAEYERVELLPLNCVQEYLLANQQTLTPLTLALLQMVVNDQTLSVPQSVIPALGSTSPRTAVIVQARKGSSRLPGKILRKLSGKTVLEHVIERLHRVRNADLVVVATTTQSADDEVAALAERCGAIIFRGDERDVLGRYLGAARAVNADVILRVTSDCPLIDPDLCEAVISARAKTDADYASNNMPRLFPHGLDCEAFTRTALEMAARDATTPYDREHVTPWLRRRPELHRANVVGPGWPANQQRWTLDYPEDLLFFDRLFAKLPADRLATWQEALSLLGQEPYLAQANAQHRVRTAMANDPSAGVVVFRMTANAKIGMGHAMRCHALATRLEALGWRCYWAATAETLAFLGDNTPPHLRIELRDEDAAADAARIGAAVRHCDALIVDDYDVSTDFAQAVRQFAEQIVYFDDLANRPMDADLIVNPTPGDWTSRYKKLNRRDARLLIGPDMALLRQQFQARRGTRQQMLNATGQAMPIKRILVAFGGVDPLNGTGLALDMLAQQADLSVDVVLGGQAPYIEDVKRQVAAMGPRVKLWTDVADMAAMMMEADLAIGAPGTSTWERGCVGLASLLVGIAENQRDNAAIVERAGAGLVAGFLTAEPREAVAATLAAQFRDLQQHPAKRRTMALAAMKLCDGRGTQRVVAALLPATDLPDGRRLRLRIVEAHDEEMLMKLQRAPETRRYALNPAIPTEEEHHRWLLERLSAVADWFLIAEVEGQAAAFVRLDWIGEDNGRPEYLISIATERSFHRQGIGAALLRAVRHLAPGAHFYAKILPDNLASLSLFARADYRLAADGFFHSYPAQHKEA
ncbi:UDP-2,4-diacetamido-2,4,6-trideoxy-beta-L-altropyranose hydrolase [Dongia sp.]|uniref:UDP-2,4-diacetamido-2,4, 6-trideoxy-beta-L-altropyranose hydrolase n=1 Tax=Dongia sp. TaxID=1977262 RepID=UPI0035B2BDAD